MIKAGFIDGKGRPGLLLGLSGENVTRLMADEPILIDGAQFGVEVTVVLVGGRTEQDIVGSLRRNGLISESTKVHPEWEMLHKGQYAANAESEGKE